MRARRRVVGQQQDAVRLARRVERVDDRADDVASQRSSASTLTSARALVAGLVGRLDVQHEQVAIVERREARARLRARSRCRSRPVAPGTSTTSMPVSTPRPCTRSTADDMRPATPYVASNDGSAGFTPWPHNQICVASQPTSRARASRRPRATRPSARAPSARPDRSGTPPACPVRSCGGVHSASAQSLRHDAQVAVLDAGMEAHAVAAVAERGVERGDDRMALRAREVPGREVDHRRRRRRRRRVTRLQRYATSSGASSTPIAAASIGARPVW